MLLLADAVDELAVDDAFTSVIQGAAARRKRRIVTRAAVGVTGVGVALLLFFSLGGTKIQTVPQVPANTAAPEIQRESAPEVDESNRKIRSSNRQPAGAKRPPRSDRSKGVGYGSSAGVAERDAETLTSVGDRSSDDFGPEETTTDASAGGVTRREIADYGRSYVSVRPDPRFHCPVDGGDCASFPVSSADRSASLIVQDRSGTLLVRVTQTDRHGRLVGEAVSFCGGTSERFPIAPTAVVMTVSVHDSDCGGEGTVSPTGGRVSAVFFGRVD